MQATGAPVWIADLPSGPGAGIAVPVHTGRGGDTEVVLEFFTAVPTEPDAALLALLSDVAADTAFSDLARARFDAKAAAAGGVRALADSDRDARLAARTDGLILYDLAWYTLGAIALDGAFPGAGYDADAGVFAGVAVDALT